MVDYNYAIMTNREKAIKWWYTLPEDIRYDIHRIERRFNPFISCMILLTGREIENIWQQLQTK